MKTKLFLLQNSTFLRDSLAPITSHSIYFNRSSVNFVCNGNPLLRRDSRAGKIEMKSGKQLLKNTLEQHFISYFTISTIDTTLSMLVFYHTLKSRFGKFYQQTKLRIKKKQKVTLLIWLFATKVRQREFS